MPLSKSKIFLTLVLSFIAGIFLGHWLNLEIMAFAAMIFIAVGSLFWQCKLFRLAMISGLVLLAGSYRYISTVSAFALPGSGKQEFRATICEEPDIRSDKTLLTLCDFTIAGQMAGYKVLATVPRVPEFRYGEKVVGTGKIMEPRVGEPGEFSYKDYLSRYAIYAVTYYPQMERVGQGGGKLKSLLLEFKQFFITRVSLVLPEPENAFLSGLLVGAKRGIPDEIMKDFSDTGTTHIIAISGFNITIIAWALDKLLSRFGRRISFVLSLLCIVLFVILTGASSSVVRAGIMGSLGLIALNLGRIYAITNALALTAAIMLGINPKLLMFDVGFQLSFLSLMGLVYLSPLIEPLFAAIPKTPKTYLVATLAAQILTLPVLLYNFDRLSLISPVANILVLPLVPIAMLSGFITGSLSLISPYLGAPAAWLTWFLLASIIKVVDVLASLPFAALNISIPSWLVPVYYFLLFAAMIYAKRVSIFAKINVWKRAQNA